MSLKSKSIVVSKFYSIPRDLLLLLHLLIWVAVAVQDTHPPICGTCPNPTAMGTNSNSWIQLKIQTRHYQSKHPADYQSPPIHGVAAWIDYGILELGKLLYLSIWRMIQLKKNNLHHYSYIQGWTIGSWQWQIVMGMPFFQQVLSIACLALYECNDKYIYSCMIYLQSILNLFISLGYYYLWLLLQCNVINTSKPFFNASIFSPYHNPTTTSSHLQIIHQVENVQSKSKFGRGWQLISVDGDGGRNCDCDRSFQFVVGTIRGAFRRFLMHSHCHWHDWYYGWYYTQHKHPRDSLIIALHHRHFLLCIITTIATTTTTTMTMTTIRTSSSITTLATTKTTALILMTRLWILQINPIVF